MVLYHIRPVEFLSQSECGRKPATIKQMLEPCLTSYSLFGQFACKMQPFLLYSLYCVVQIGYKTSKRTRLPSNSIWQPGWKDQVNDHLARHKNSLYSILVNWQTQIQLVFGLTTPCASRNASHRLLAKPNI